MSLIGEATDSRAQTVTWNGGDCTLKFWVNGTEDELAVMTIAEAEAPAFYTPVGGPKLIIQSIEIDPVGGGIWLCSAKYGPLTPKQTGESTYTFDTGGGTQKITQSLNTVGSYAPGAATAPNFHGAIGVGADGQVEGCEITVPVFNWTEIWYVANASVTNAYIAALYQATGKTNNAPWRNKQTGEVLFLGASGSYRGQEDWEITFKFAASPNITGLTLGGITGISKGGWQYLWARYVDGVDNVANAIVKKLLAVYVEQVYQSADMTTLGIG